MLVIEQPELHLHPDLQGKLVQAFIDVITSNHCLRLVLETHSKTFLEELGRDVYEKRIDIWKTGGLASSKQYNVRWVLFCSGAGTAGTTIPLFSF